MSVDAKNSDTLQVIAEKLKQLTNDTQDQYESFIDAVQLYKNGNVNQKDFLAKLADYLIGMTSLNFIAIQALFEVKLATQTNLSKGESTTNHLSKSYRRTEGSDTVGIQKSIGLVDDSTNRATTMTKSTNLKNCIVCGSIIPSHAKFCNKCGNSQ